MPPIHPIPNGTRDVLPDEMREIRAISEAIRGVFEAHGYGEVWTPAIEYESVVGAGRRRPGASTACSTTRAASCCCART